MEREANILEIMSHSVMNVNSHETSFDGNRNFKPFGINRFLKEISKRKKNYRLFMRLC